MLSYFHRDKLVCAKTDGRCSICGVKDNLVFVSFIPAWTRASSKEVKASIPLCTDCYLRTRYSFIELGQLKYLPKLYIDELMTGYKPIAQYLYKYVRLYGVQRTNGKLDVDKALLTLYSYNEYIKELEDWKSIK